MKVSQQLKDHVWDLFYFLSASFGHGSKGRMEIWVDPVAYIHLFHAIHEELSFNWKMEEYKEQGSTSGATFMQIDFGRAILVVRQKEEYEPVFKEVPEPVDSIKELFNFVLEENIGIEFKPDRSRDAVVVKATEYNRSQGFAERAHNYIVTREYLQYPSPMIKNTINNLVRIMTRGDVWKVNPLDKKGGK